MKPAESAPQIEPEVVPCSFHLQDVLFQTSDQQFELSIKLFSALQGEKTAITGPSGSGKTTLLSLISGYKQATSGKIKVLGRNLNSMSDAERETLRLQEIGMIFQDFRLIEYLTVRENISLTSCFMPRNEGDKKRERIDAIATQLKLNHLLSRHPGSLSHGERQRTAIGRAIFQSPKIILADEPTGNLDPKTALKTLDYLFQVIEQEQATLVMVTHDFSLLPRFTKQIDMAELCGNN